MSLVDVVCSLTFGVVCCPLCVTCCLLVVSCMLFVLCVVCYVTRDVSYLLCVVCCLVFAVDWGLRMSSSLCGVVCVFVASCLVLVARCLLFVVCSSLDDDCIGW